MSLQGQIIDNMNLRYPNVDDLAKAYHQLWMLPSDINLLGYVSDSLFYTDVTLSMESSSVDYCCQRTTNATNFIYQLYRIKDVNYLDDLGSAEEEGKVEEAYDCLR